MYYPKSQVKTNLYTNGGEYITVNTNQEYKGFYWVNSKNQVFSGKTPQYKPSVRLTKLNTEHSEEPDTLKKTSDWVEILPNGISQTKAGLSPNKYYPSPSEDQYRVGEFTRFFTKKTNQNIYYEISHDDYTKIQNRDDSIKWQLYQGIQLKWILSGDKEEVYKANRNVVRITELTQKLPGFSKIFRKEYLQFYK